MWRPARGVILGSWPPERRAASGTKAYSVPFSEDQCSSRGLNDLRSINYSRCRTAPMSIIPRVLELFLQVVNHYLELWHCQWCLDKPFIALVECISQTIYIDTYYVQHSVNKGQLTHPS